VDIVFTQFALVFHKM